MKTLRTYYLELADRAAKTAAQSAVLVIGADQLNALSVDWHGVLGFALGGAILSLLTNIAHLGILGRATGNSDTE